MKNIFTILLIIFFIKISQAQVMSKDSLWIDKFFDSVDLIVIPQFEFIFSDLTLDPMVGKKVSIPNNLKTDWSEFALKKEIPFNVLYGGGLSVGLQNKAIDVFISYYTGWNRFRDNSYDSPYKSADNIKIGDGQILIEKISLNSHYWITKTFGIGLEYKLFSSTIHIIHILDNTNGIISLPIADFYIHNNFLYLYTPIKFKFNKFNIKFLAGFSLYSNGKGSTSINAIDNNFEKDNNAPFGIKLNLGINTKLFNYLPVGIMYKFNYLSSKSEYKYLINTISLQIGIPRL